MYAFVNFFSLVIMSAVSIGDNPLSPCPVGFIPPECIHECHDGYYGVNCMSLCSASCLNMSCRPQNGDCYRCQVGFFGPMCAEKCRQGSHGVNCSMPCPVNCLDRLCDPFSGYCLNCIDGYGGSKCEDVKRLQSLPIPAKQVSPSEKNDHTVLYISIIVVTVTLPVCTVSLWVFILKKKFKEIYYKRYLEGARSFSPIYRDPKDSLPFLESNYGDPNDKMKSLVQQVYAKHRTSPLRSPGKRPRKHVPRPRDKSKPKNSAGAGGERPGAKAFPPDVNEDDLKQMLKRNNPLLLSQAANYTDDLFFKTPKLDLKPAQESCVEKDHPPETRGAANRLAKGATPWSLVSAGDSPRPHDHEKKTSPVWAKDVYGLKYPASAAVGNTSIGNHVSEQTLQVYQVGVDAKQQNATEQGDRDPGLPSPYSATSTRMVQATASYEKGTNVCYADLVKPVSLHPKQIKSSLIKLWRTFSSVTRLGSWRARNKKESVVPSTEGHATKALFAHQPPQEKAERPSVANRNLSLRNAHKAYSCPVIISRDHEKHKPTPQTQVTNSVPTIKQPIAYPIKGDVLRACSQQGPASNRGTFSGRCSEVPYCNAKIVSQSEAVTKTTVHELVPWTNDIVQTYSQEHKYSGAFSPLRVLSDGRKNCFRPLPIQESNAPDPIYMPDENADFTDAPLSPSVARWPVTSLLYTSHCIESAAGHPVSRCPSPVICETIDVLNATVNTQVSVAAPFNNTATVSDDQQSSAYLSLCDSTKNSTQHRIPDLFSPDQSTNLHRFQGNSTADNHKYVEDNDMVLVNVGVLGAQTRCQKRSTQTRLTGAKQPAHIGRTGASVQRKNVRTRMSRMISRDEVPPVLYSSPRPSPGLVVSKTESYTKCTPSGLVKQLTDQHVRFMNATPMAASRSSQEGVDAQSCQAIELYEHHNTGNDIPSLNHLDSTSIRSADAQKVPDHESFFYSTIPTGRMGSPDFSSILKEANCRGMDSLNSGALKRSESKPPKGLMQRMDKVGRRKPDSPLQQRPFVPSPGRKFCYTPSPSKVPLNISRNNAPTICCHESTKYVTALQETPGDLTSPYNFRLNDSTPGQAQADWNNTSEQTSPKQPVAGLEGAFSGSISNNSSGGPESPRDPRIFRYRDRRSNDLREDRVQMRQTSEAMARGDLSDNRVNICEVTDPKETYAEACSLHCCHQRRAQLSVPRECFAGFGGCDSDLNLPNTHSFGRVSSCSLKGDRELPRNQNNVLDLNDTVKKRSPALLRQMECEDLTHNAVNTCARLASYRQAPVLHNNPLSPRLAIMGKGTRVTGLKHLRKTRLSFPLYDINCCENKENPLVPLCKKPSSELTSGHVVCKRSDLNPLVKISRVVISEPTSSDSSSCSTSSSETKSGRREDKGTCVNYLQVEEAPSNNPSSLLPTNWHGAAMRNMLRDEGVYRSKEDSNLPTGVLQSKNDDEKGLTQPRQNIHFVLKSPSLRKCPRRMRNGRVCRSQSPCIAAQYPMPSILEAVAQTDDNTFDEKSRFARGDRSDDPPKPGPEETAVLIYKSMAECRSCPLFSRGSSLPASLHSAHRKALLVDQGVNTAFNHPTVDAGCQCVAPIINVDKSCLAKKKSILRELRPEERTEYRSIIEGDSEFFYDAMDYRDFESNTSKEQSDLTFTKSIPIEPTDKVELNRQKQKKRRFLLLDLMNRHQRNRCHLSRLVPSATPNSFANPPSKLKQSSLDGGSSQGVHRTEPRKTSATGGRMVVPKKKFALILAHAAAKQTGSTSAERGVKSWLNRSDRNSLKNCLKERGGESSKRISSGLTILACSWQAEKGVHEADTQRAGEGSEGSSTWTASGGNPKPATPKRAVRQHGIPPRS